MIDLFGGRSGFNPRTGFVGAITPPAPIIRYSMNFDGINQYILNGDILDTEVISGNNQTYEFWYKADTIGFNLYPILKWLPNSNQRSFFIVRTDLNNWSFIFTRTGRTGSLSRYTTSAVFTDTAGWHHIAFVLTLGEPLAADKMKVYHDGVEHTVIHTGGNEGSVFSTGMANLNIGGDSDGIRLWNGNLDEVRIWDFAMTAADVTSIYNGGVPRTPIIAEYPANEQFYLNFEQNVLDQSQNSNDGTLINSPTYETDVP